MPSMSSCRMSASPNRKNALWRFLSGGQRVFQAETKRLYQMKCNANYKSITNYVSHQSNISVLELIHQKVVCQPSNEDKGTTLWTSLPSLPTTTLAASYKPYELLYGQKPVTQATTLGKRNEFPFQANYHL